MPFYMLIISDQLCNANGPPAQVQNELAVLLVFGETLEFLQVFALCETLVPLVEVKAVTKS